MLIEDKYNINLSFCSLPIKRTTIVLSKYTSYFCVLLVTTMLTILASLLLKTMFGEVLNYIDITKVMSIQYISIVIIFSSLISSMTIPFYFKSGYPKGLFMGIFLFLMVMGVCIGFVYIIVSLKTGNWGIERYSNIENQNSLSFIIGLIGYAVDVFPEKNIFIYMMLITISCTLASFKLAIKFFKNREL